MTTPGQFIASATEPSRAPRRAEGMASRMSVILDAPHSELPASMHRLVIGAILLVLAAPPAATQSMPERLASCLACHGESGQSERPDVPSLGGQPVFYLTVQLLMFRERMRAVEPMTSMLQGVSDDMLREVAEAIAKLPPPRPIAEQPDTGRSARSRTLIQQHRCNVCHRPDFSG